MGLLAMQKRLLTSGTNTREELVKDGRDLLAEELKNDPSYSPTMYLYKYNREEEWDDRLANIRLYKRGYSSLTGFYQKFLTTVDNPIYVGNYLHDVRDNTFWIVNEAYYEDDIHYRGKMIQCNYNLRWQTNDGIIINRYVNAVTAAKYNTGVDGNYIVNLTSNNYTVLVGYDEYALELDEKRVFIDMHETNPTKVFKFTRSDDIIDNAGGIGRILSYITTKTEFNPARDNQELRVCDYISPEKLQKPDLKKQLHAKINGLPQLKLAFPRTYSVSFYDEQLEEITDVTYSWIVDADFYVSQEIIDGNIKLQVDGDMECGKTFKLSILVDGEILTSIEIMIVEGM